MTTTEQRAERLLDAQVAWVMAALEADRTPDDLARDVDDLLDLAAHVTLADAVPGDVLAGVVVSGMTSVAGSPGAASLVETVATLVHEGSGTSVTLADLVAREDVERLLDEAHRHADELLPLLDALAESPLVSGLAARFLGRMVGEVLAMNQAVARRVPGVGSLVSAGMAVGTSAAGKVLGAAEKQLGDPAAKSTTYLIRRLNVILAEIAADPVTRAAALEVFDLYADRPVPAPADRGAALDDTLRLARAGHELVTGVVVSEPVRALVEAVCARLVEQHGDRPLADVLADLGVDRDLLLAQATTLAPSLPAAARRSGRLEALVRARLAPFFASPEVAAVLAD